MSKARDKMFEMLDIRNKLDIPTDYMRFCEDLLPHYIFRLSRRKNTECMCFGCRNTYFAENTKSGAEATCPICGYKGIYKVYTDKSFIYDKVKTALIEEIDGIKFISIFEPKRIIRKDMSIERHYDDFACTSIDENGNRNFYKFYSTYCQYKDWHPLGNTYCFDSAYVYPQTVFPEFTRYNGLNVPIDEYIYNNTLLDVKPCLTQYTKVYGFNSNMSYVLKSAKFNETVDFFHKNNVDINKTQLERLEEIIGYRDYSCIGELFKLMSVEKMLNYFNRQKTFYENETFYKPVEMFHDYCDYISMCDFLSIELNKSTRFPSNLKLSHDTLATRKREVELSLLIKKQEEERRAEIAKRKAKLESVLPILFNIQNAFNEMKDTYCAVVPTEFKQFIAESESLSICVGKTFSYFDRHIAQKSLIVFIRKANHPRKSFCCLEINMSKCEIVQLRAFGNTRPNDDVWAYAESLCKALAKASFRKVA